MSTPDSMRLGEVDPLVLTRPADGARLAAAIAIDFLLPVAFSVAAIVALTGGAVAFGAVLFVIAAALLAVTAFSLARTGRTLGSVAARTRTVRRSTGAAAGSDLIPALLAGDLGTFDLARGRDPFAPALAPFQFPEPVPNQILSARIPSGRPPVVQLDSGQRIALESALILGRNPAMPLDAPAALYQWPDLSRTLSKSHARLEWDGRLVWVTDLGSTNGTHIQNGGVSQPLLPFQRTPVQGALTLELGDRVVTIGSAP